MFSNTTTKLFDALYAFIDLDQIWVGIYEIELGWECPVKPEQEPTTMPSRL